MKRLIVAIALAAAMVTVLLPGAVTAAHATPSSGAVTAAHATPVSRAQAVRKAKSYLEFSARRIARSSRGHDQLAPRGTRRWRARVRGFRTGSGTSPTSRTAPRRAYAYIRLERAPSVPDSGLVSDALSRKSEAGS